MESSELRYNLEPWEYDFMVKHLLSNEDVIYYDEGEKELLAETERNGSTVYFHTTKDSNVTWFSVFSMNEDEELSENYLESVVEDRLESVFQRSRDTLGIEYDKEDVNAVAGI
jgi:hypothetical protein